jgi:23S rRNA pseudouridine2605 synthase
VPVRLNRFLAAAGLGSRRGVERLIAQGRVTVNGAPAGIGDSVAAGDDVRVDGQPVAAQPSRWVLLHKPAGVVTTARDPQGRPTVVELVPSAERLFPVGRLDRDTTGALLLTNDGELAHRLMHPSHGIEKVYVADVQGQPGPDVLERLRRGVELDDGVTAPAEASLLAPSRIQLKLHEGRNRQVRRMCEAVGHPVVHLHRSGYAGLTLAGLAGGQWRELTSGEIEALRAAVSLLPS